MAEPLTNNVVSDEMAYAQEEAENMMKHFHMDVLGERLKILDDEIKRREDSVVELKQIKGIFQFCYDRAKNMETALKRIAAEKKRAAAGGDGQEEEAESSFNPDAIDRNAEVKAEAGRVHK